jgi:Fic family protein
MPKPLPLLPITIDVETKTVLKQVIATRAVLAELKGLLLSIPNQNIFIDALTLREAKDSSGIENIISTMDELYQSSAAANQFASSAAKEVYQYAAALKKGFALVKEKQLLTNNMILDIQAIIEQNNAGFRKLPGTKLMNNITGQTVYTPPQDYDTITGLMQNLEAYINEDKVEDADPLIKMAIIHHQFESIHPFYDGNGRTGRIINILYLVLKGLLDLPVLYLSKYIILTKNSYYRLLQEVREKQNWEAWILYILQGVQLTAHENIQLITAIKQQMDECKELLKSKTPKIYTRELLYNLYKYPYTKIEYVQNDADVTRNTAIKYLAELEKLGIVNKVKKGKTNFYVNTKLMALLSNDYMAQV